MTKFFELFLSAGDRAPAAIVGRLTQEALALFNRGSRRRGRSDHRVPLRYLSMKKSGQYARGPAPHRHRLAADG